MERLLSLAIATAGVLAGLLIATGRVADVVVPLMVALGGVVALRAQHGRSRTEP